MNQQKVNSVIETSDGTFLVAETLEQIQQLAQNDKLVLVHIEQPDTKEFNPFLVNVDRIKMALDFNIDYVGEGNPHDEEEDDDDSLDVDAARNLLKAFIEEVTKD